MAVQPHRFLGELTVSSDGSQADIDAAAVLDPDVFASSGAPFDAFKRLRQHAPVHPVRLPGIQQTVWLCTGYDDVRAVSRDDDTFASRFGNTLVAVEMVETSALLPGIDPPRHTHFRKLINRAFTRRNVLRLEDSIRQSAWAIVDEVIDKGEFDAVADISAAISLSVIAEVMGVPHEDRHEIFRWSNAIGSLGIEDEDYAPDQAALGGAVVEMFSYCGDLVARRRAEGLQDDILSALLAAEVDGVGLNEDQLNEFFLLLSVAGNETTRNTLSHAILALSEHPDQRAALASDPTVIPGAIEEMLRWATPVLHFRRTVMRTTELGGQTLHEGDWVVIHYLSANRDESAFEQPQEFDIFRDDAVKHVAFGGGGTHFCLGAQLAKLEMRVMLEELYARVPNLAVTGPPARLRSSFFHGIKRLPCAPGF
jgi:cytochrome P450